LLLAFSEREGEEGVFAEMAVAGNSKEATKV